MVLPVLGNTVLFLQFFIDFCIYSFQLTSYISVLALIRFSLRPAHSISKERGQWLDNSAEPTPGMIIFFDWDSPDGSSGPQDGLADHTGIVQKVENGVIYTVEGNSGDSVRVNQYPIGYYEILGFGAPEY